MIFLPAGRSSTSTPVSPPSSSGSTSRSRPSPPGKSVAATSSKCSATAWKVSANRRSTVSASSSRSSASSLQALLEILPLHLELGEPLLLGLVLLLRERIDLAELAPALLEPLGARRELVALVALRRVGGGLLEPAAGVGRLGLDPGQLDLDLRRPLRGLLGALPQLDLGRAELPQRRSQLARAAARRRRRGRGAAPRSAAAVATAAAERLAEPLGAGEHAPEQVGVEHLWRASAVPDVASGRRPGGFRRVGRRDGEPLGRLGQLARLALDLLALRSSTCSIDLPSPPSRRAPAPRRHARSPGRRCALVLEPPTRRARCELAARSGPPRHARAAAPRAGATATAGARRRGARAGAGASSAGSAAHGAEMRDLGVRGLGGLGLPRRLRRLRLRLLRLGCSSATSPASSRRRVSSSSSTASAASPANQSSPRCGS